MYKKRIKKILINIKLRRLELGYSQKFMADKLQISQNLYSKIEMNNIKLIACRFLVICDVLGIDAAKLLSAK